MNTDKFTGFTPETLRFFRDLEENNCKPWFDANKHVYEQKVAQPFKALATALTPAMYSIDPRFEFRPYRVVSRIYRDTRFSPDKTPYKTCTWLTFQRPVPDWQNYPGFYMELSARGYIYGMGLYAAKKQVMEDFRSRVEYDPDHFRSITENLTGKRGFAVNGELYKRPLNNGLDEYFQSWLQRKSVWLSKSCPVGDEIFDERFLRILEDDFTAMKDLYDFFCESD
jgi:uncharacterized protein (TIGR02453 family)